MDKKWLKYLPLTNIKKIIPVPGGDVNDAYRIETVEETYFLLVQRNKSKAFYTAEIAGLKEIKKADVNAPGVIASGEIEGNAYLILEFLEEGTGAQADLGKLVAKLHKFQSDHKLFGFYEDYKGKDVTFNQQWTDSWIEMFIEKRLDHMRNILIEKNLWSQQEIDQYNEARVIMIMELEKHHSVPSLLHGDLWSGNYMFLSDGQPVLFDPASFYGDREFDIGVSTVFGGFSDEFYEVYQEEYPMAEGYEIRLNFYRLHMLMLHLVKFGSVYTHGVNKTLNHIIQSGQ